MPKKEIPRNRVCWAKGCERERFGDDFLCKKCSKKKDVKMGVPGIKGFDNTPSKYD